MSETDRRIETNKDLSPHLLRMMFDEPFFARILRGVNIEFGEAIPTAGVMVKDGDVHMLVNPDFVSGLKDDHIKGLLKHECFHLAFEHCTSRRLEPHNIANIAADLAINSDIPASELPEGGLVPGEAFKGEGSGSPLSLLIEKLPKHKSQEWYFTQIMKDDDAKDQAKNPGGNGEGEPGFDNHDGWGEMSDEEKELVKGKLKEVLKQAVKEGDRTGKWGSVGSDMRDKLREMVSNEVDWRSILKQFCGLSRRGTRTTTWSNVNMVHLHPKWGPLATGAKRGYTSSIAVYIDQSGSVGNEELELAFAELRNLARATEFTTFHFDTSVDEESEVAWKKGRTPKTHRTRCGGTDFQCVTEHANKNRSRFDGYIIITDGEASKPKPSKLKRCWLLVPGRKLLFESDKRDFTARMKHVNATD
jgi:predicted metal-dependent peptidase